MAIVTTMAPSSSNSFLFTLYLLISEYKVNKLFHEERQTLLRLLENNLFMRITRMSLMLVLISMLSGCCCLWYVAVDEPEVYSKQKSKVKTNTVQNPVTKKKDAIEKTK